jgi:hypothetical protein
VTGRQGDGGIADLHFFNSFGYDGVIPDRCLLNIIDVHFKPKKGSWKNGYFLGMGYAFKIARRIMSGTDRPSSAATFFRCASSTAGILIVVWESFLCFTAGMGRR